MNTILVAILLLTDIIKYIVIFDIILSWLSVFWLNIRPKFIADIIDPTYKKIKWVLPTTFWPIDFTPIIILFILIIIKWVVISIDPNIAQYYLEITKF